MIEMPYPSTQKGRQARSEGEAGSVGRNSRNSEGISRPDFEEERVTLKVGHRLHRSVTGTDVAE